VLIDLLELEEALLRIARPQAENGESILPAQDRGLAP
jgi:hypothetical protein